MLLNAGLRFAGLIMCCWKGNGSVLHVSDGLFRLQTAVDARHFGLETWWLIFALAVITGAAGIAVAVHPSESALTLTGLTGAALMAEGLMNLCVALCAVKIVSHQQLD